MSDISKIAASTMEKAGLHSVKIKGQTYTIELLPATQALAIATELFKIASPSVAAYFDSANRKDFVLPEEENTFTEVAILLVNQLEKVSVIDLVSVLTSKVYKNSVPVDIDEEFKGNLGGLIILLEFILKENVGPLLQDWFESKGINLQKLFSDQKDKKEDTTD